MKWSVAGIRCLAMPIVLFASTNSASALIPQVEPSIAERMVLADRVVLARVSALEPDLVSAPPSLPIPGAANVVYQIALLQVEKAMRGGDKQPELRVGFLAPPDGSQGNAARLRRFIRVKLAVDQQGCFFLHKHPSEPFYVVRTANDVLDRKGMNHDRDLALVQRCAGLMVDLPAALKSKEQQDRYLAAAMLIFRYRSAPIYAGTPKTEPIPADDSRRILAILAEGDWSEAALPLQLSPLRLLLRLDPTEADGWKLPRTQGDDGEAVRQWLQAGRLWLQDHGNSYRIQRYLPEK